MTTDLFEALNAAPPPDKRLGCYYRTWYSRQDTQTQEVVDRAMKDPSWTTQALFDLFSKNGYARQYNSLRTHRVGDCSCPHE